MFIFSKYQVLFFTILAVFCFSKTSHAADYTYFNSKDRHVITINGEFKKGDVQDFQNFLNHHLDVKYILLQSNGGSLNEAMKIGKVIRNHHLNTAVETYCRSACFAVLMAGKSRYVYKDAYVGVHQPFFIQSGKNVADKRLSSTYHNLYDYFYFMIGNENKSQNIVDIMYKTSPNRMYEISSRDHYAKIKYYDHSVL